ncbi:MAG: hypothetical protein OXK80_04290 [Bdellovibrionales bacterium]|nr:hypothetical protein [Bdellovibrionales bacterium]
MNKTIKQKKRLKRAIQSALSLMLILFGLISYYLGSDFFKSKHETISCRIGITTDLENRKKTWQRIYEKEGKTIKNWTVLSKHYSKSSAQEAEKREAKLQNCKAHPGGRKSRKTIWYLYKIEH